VGNLAALVHVREAPNSGRMHRSNRSLCDHLSLDALPLHARIPVHQSAFMPWISHGLPAEPGEPPPITDVPLTHHSSNCPVLVLYQRMSLLPSPLKSPVSAIVQGLTTEPGEPPPIIDPPFISQITTCPLVVLYQRMSLIPSPLKSPVP